MKSMKHPYLDEQLYFSDDMENMMHDVLRDTFECSFYTEFLGGKHDLVCVDVGANVGIVTSLIRRVSKVVYAIEPAAEHFGALCMNKMYNHWDNVEPVNLAVSNKVGSGTLSIHPANATMHSIVWHHRIPPPLNIRTPAELMAWHNKYSQTVNLITLSTFLTERGIEHVDFLKIDVEGGEYDILECETFEKVQAMEVEFHGVSNEYIKRLMALGFTTVTQKDQPVASFLFVRP